MEDYLIKKRRSFFSVVMVLFWFSLYAYMPQMTTYAKELGASYKLIGLIAGAYGVTQTILRIPLGIVSDKLMNRKAFIIFNLSDTIYCTQSVYSFSCKTICRSGICNMGQFYCIVYWIFY